MSQPPEELEPIRITPAELSSPQVEERLREQKELEKARAESARAQEQGAHAFRKERKKLRYVALVYLTVFGVAGGLLGAILAEAPLEAFARKEWLAPVRAAEGIDDSVRELLEEGKSSLRDFGFDDLSDELDSLASEGELPTNVMLLSYGKSIMWLGLIGIVLGFCLCSADNFVLQNWRGVLIAGSLGMVGGLLGGSVGGVVGNFFFLALVDPESQSAVGLGFSRAVSWAFFGMLLASGQGFALRSKAKVTNTLLGGAIGGLIGGILFDPIGQATGQAGAVSRLVGLGVFGLAVGGSIGLVEHARKEGWLDVLQGRIAGKQFILYRNPTVIGSGYEADVYLFQDAAVAPVHTLIRRRANLYEVEDAGSQSGTFVNGQPVTRAILQDGDQLRVGSTVMQYSEKRSSRGRKR